MIKKHSLFLQLIALLFFFYLYFQYLHIYFLMFQIALLKFVQFLLQLLATRRAFFLAVNIRVIGFGSDVVDPQPFCHPFGIPLRQRVNDSAAVKVRNRLRQPSHPRSGARHLDVLQLETLPHERSTHNLNACPELRGHVINHTVIGRRCCRENRNVARQRLQVKILTIGFALTTAKAI